MISQGENAPQARSLRQKTTEQPPDWLLSPSKMRSVVLFGLWTLIGGLFVGLGLWGTFWPPRGWHTESVLLVMGGAGGVGLSLWALALLLRWRQEREIVVHLAEWLGWMVLSLYLGIVGARYFGGWETPLSGAFALLIAARGALLPGGWRAFLPVALFLWGIFTACVWWFSFAPLDANAAWRRLALSHLFLASATALGAFASWLYQHLQHQLNQTDRLGRYDLQERLNQSGMSQVFLAWNRLLAQPCVIKRMPCHAAHWERAVEEFRREAHLTLKIQSPHVVRILDFGETDHDLYLVMEALQGINLFALLQLQGPLPRARILHLMRQACQGIEAVHQQGILHRDIKPSNLFVTFQDDQYDFLKVLDFGIARRLSANAAQQAARGHGKNPGTPAYMAPERFYGGGDIPADIYALGIVFYTLLTGESLVHAGDIPTYQRIHEEGAFNEMRLRQCCPNLPESIIAVLRCALERDPKARYPSARAMHDAIAACQESVGAWTQADARRAWEALTLSKQPPTTAQEDEAASPHHPPHQPIAPSNQPTAPPHQAPTHPPNAPHTKEANASAPKEADASAPKEADASAPKTPPPAPSVLEAAPIDSHWFQPPIK